MNSKERYRKFCYENDSLPIFIKDWWLDAVCSSGEWDVAIVEDKNGDIKAAMPYYIRRKFGFNIITMPKLTQKLGAWIHFPSNLPEEKKISHENKYLLQLLAQLPKKRVGQFTYFMDHSFKNWLPFYWNGYNQQTYYTYIIEDISNIDSVINKFDSGKKGDLRKAIKHVKIETCDDIDWFYNFHKQCLKKKEQTISYSRTLIHMIWRATQNNKCSKIFRAVDDVGNVHSALFVVWDSQAAYHLITPMDSDFNYSQSLTLCVVEAIKFLQNKTSSYDFEGSMITGVERSYRSFGSTQTAYFCLTKKTRFFKLIDILRLK